LPGVDWESCMTMNDTWGFKSYDENWKAPQKIIRNLIDIASKGGNYLLNVGPTAEGLIPQPSIDRLESVGKWMKINGEAIYGTTASPFESQLSFGRATRKANRIYLHVFDWPVDGKLKIPGIGKPITTAYLLSAPKTHLKFVAGGDGVSIEIPSRAPDEIASVIVLEIGSR